MYDFDELPGTAHLLEHVLHWSNGSDYMNFVHHHGGFANATTIEDMQLYYFDIDPDHLLGALEK